MTENPYQAPAAEEPEAAVDLAFDPVRRGTLVGWGRACLFGSPILLITLSASELPISFVIVGMLGAALELAGGLGLRLCRNWARYVTAAGSLCQIGVLFTTGIPVLTGMMSFAVVLALLLHVWVIVILFEPRTRAACEDRSSAPKASVVRTLFCFGTWAAAHLFMLMAWLWPYLGAMQVIF